MKHVSSNIEVAGETQVRVPTRRALAKQQTRTKVLAAARRLFSEAGYEGATIRDIAAEAGMSTGAVFANFTDKSDLFREIMVADMEALVEAMREGASRGRGVDEGLADLDGAEAAFRLAVGESASLGLFDGDFRFGGDADEVERDALQ